MDPIQLSNLKHIQSASQAGRLVMFVGAGVSVNSGVPAWNGLIEAMKRDLPDALKNEKDDLKVAQMYRDSRGYKEYLDKVKETLKFNQTIPNPIHKAILDLLPVHLITTNYDDLLEQEIKKEYHQYSIIRQDADLPNMAYPNALIKMHGDFITNNIVLAEDDYYGYSRNFALIRAYVQSLFASKLVVFVGFSFADLNLKIILDEVRDILNEQMQPVYLISDQKPDEATIKYFENKKVHIVHLDNCDLQKMCKKCKLEHSSAITNLQTKGQYLWDILSLIKTYDFSEQTDLLTYVYNKLSLHKDEMRVYGRGLQYFFPNNLERFIWNEHSDGLQTTLPYFDNLATKLTSREGKAWFIKKYGKDKCRDFIRLAYYNYLYRIDDLHVIENEESEGLSKLIPSHVADYVTHFNYDDLLQRLRELSQRDISCSISDLEYGYAYYKVGDYYRAYLEFDKILPLAWERGKYILYFICLYNIYSLRYAIRNQFIWTEDPDVDVSKLCEKLNNIDLQRTLDKLPIPFEIRKIFQDVIGHKYTGEHAAETGELNGKLHQQNISSRRGGVSMNSNLISLEGKYEREIRFGKYNYMLNDIGILFGSVIRNTVSGILNSYATKDRERDDAYFHMQNTRIISFGEAELEILIFGLGNQKLRETCIQYEIDDFKIDDSGRNYLITCVRNLKSDSFKKFGTLTVKNSLLNLLYVLSRIETIGEVDPQNIYNVVGYLLSGHEYISDLGRFLKVLIKKYPPVKEDAIFLLNRITTYFVSDDRLESTLEVLCQQLHDSGYVMAVYPACLTYKDQATIKLPIYDLLNDKDKERFISEFLPKIEHFGYYMHFMFYHELVPQSVEKFRDRLFNYSDAFESNIACNCYFLSKWRKRESYMDLWPSIDEYGDKSKCMKFFLNPFDYPNPDKVKAEWIKFLNKETVRELVKKQPYAHKLLEYINRTYMTPATRLAMLEVFEPREENKN